MLSLSFVATWSVATAADIGLGSPPAKPATKAVRSGLTLDTGNDANTLAVRAGQPVRFRLNLPGLEGWTTANVGHFVIRTYGKQQAISPTPAAGADYLEHTFSEPGIAMVILAVGPAAEKGKSDSWQRTTHCTKLIVRVAADSAAGAVESTVPLDPGQTTKVGSMTEILPLIAPTSLRVGHHLPVRIYFNGRKQKHAEVTAHRPDATTDTQTTDSVGATHFAITQPGRWIIRYAATREGTAYIGDLVFDVPGEVGEQGGAP